LVDYGNDSLIRQYEVYPARFLRVLVQIYNTIFWHQSLIAADNWVEMFSQSIMFNGWLVAATAGKICSKAIG